MSNDRFVKPRLEHLHHVLTGYVHREEITGCVALLSRGDALHVEMMGTLSVGDAAQMGRDAIFRIASMTKPMCAAVAMMLVEDGKLRLDDSIEPWIPELANRKVMKSIGGAIEDTVPAERAITVRDLFTYRMGLGSIMAPPGAYPIQQRIRERKIGGDGPPLPTLALPTDAWLKNLGSLPLLAQPGARWMYNLSGDVLGVLVERVAGVSLGQVMRERLFEPLEMKDTAFFVAPEHRKRFSSAYRFDHQTMTLDLYDSAVTSAWGSQPPFESGAGGLVSTIDDCFAFQRMLLDKGRHGREQILSRAAVELMTTDQLEPAQRAGSEVLLGNGGWGFGMQVDLVRDEIFKQPGRFGWTGGLGTTGYTDPKEGFIGILLTQRLMDSPTPPTVMTDFWTIAYSALA